MTKTADPVQHLRDLKADPRNARRHSERNLAAVETSVREVGFMRPMVAANDGTIIGGNLTAEALAALGMEDVIVVRSDGTRPIVHIRDDVAPGSELAIKGGLYDNLASDLSDGYHGDVLAALLEEVDLSATLLTEAEAAALIAALPRGHDDAEDSDDDPGTSDAGEPDDEQEDEERGNSDGSLLSLVDVTIADPRHVTHRGQVWTLGHHVLIVSSVATDFPTWLPYLKADCLFCPYPGPFAPLTIKAETTPLVMVQPNTYIAGHILDRWDDVKGEGDAKPA